MNADCSAVPPQPTQTRQVLDSRKQMGVATEPLCPLVLSEVESLISVSWLLVKLECDILNFNITVLYFHEGAVLNHALPRMSS